MPPRRAGFAPSPEGAGRGPANPGGLDDEGKEQPAGLVGPRTAAVAEQQGPAYLLFRFFDFNVKPGKQYRYRVFLVLKNPNFGLPTEYLADPALAKQHWVGEKEVTKDADKNIIGVKIDEREAKWSEPTDVIAVPDDMELLVEQVKPRGRSATAEPGGMVWVTAWAEKRGIKAHEEFPIVIGKVADFPGCHFRPHYSAVERRTVGAESPASVPVDYVTGQLVVDMTGGERLPHGDMTLTRPGEMVVMDKSGNLVIHDELQDTAAYQDFVRRPDATSTDTTKPGKKIIRKAKDEIEEFEDQGPAAKKTKSRRRP